MLYDSRLDVFLASARAGSFSAAARYLYLTPTAVMKQMSALESELEMQLFVRSHRGLELTDAGRQLQVECRQVRDWSLQAMERLRSARNGLHQEIRICTSALTPPELLGQIWPVIQPNIPDLHCHLVPFANRPEEGRRILAHLGEEIDVVSGVFDERLLNLRQCAGLALKECPLMMAVPFGHRLWEADHIALSDLAGEIILCICQGWSTATDRARSLLEKRGSVETFEYYTPEILVRAINENKPMVAFEVWKDLNPLLPMIPVDWDCSLSYGFLHARNPQGAMRRFLKAIEQNVLSRNLKDRENILEETSNQ